MAKAQKLMPFEIAERQIKHMSFDERIALMKLLSASMDGPRFFTSEDVKAIVRDAVVNFANERDGLRASGLVVPGGIQ